MTAMGRWARIESLYHAAPAKAPSEGRSTSQQSARKMRNCDRKWNLYSAAREPSWQARSLIPSGDLPGSAAANAVPDNKMARAGRDVVADDRVDFTVIAGICRSLRQPR
jgi:hypothetical protein